MGRPSRNGLMRGTRPVPRLCAETTQLENGAGGAWRRSQSAANCSPSSFSLLSLFFPHLIELLREIYGSTHVLVD